MTTRHGRAQALTLELLDDLETHRVDLPVYAGELARRALYFRFGIPKSCPHPGEPRRVVYEGPDGEPRAYWIPLRKLDAPVIGSSEALCCTSKAP